MEKYTEVGSDKKMYKIEKSGVAGREE